MHGGYYKYKHLVASKIISNYNNNTNILPVLCMCLVMYINIIISRILTSRIL